MLNYGMNLLTYGVVLRLKTKKEYVKNFYFFLDNDDLFYGESLSDNKFVYNESRIQLVNCYDLIEEDMDCIRERSGKQTFINGLSLNYKGKIFSFIFEDARKKQAIYEALTLLIQEAKNKVYLQRQEGLRVQSMSTRKRNGIIDLQRTTDCLKQGKTMEDIASLTDDQMIEFYKEFIELFDKYGQSQKAHQKAMNVGPQGFYQRKLKVCEVMHLFMSEQKEMALPARLDEVNQGNPNKVEVWIYQQQIRKVLMSPRVYGKNYPAMSFNSVIKLLINKSNSIFCPYKMNHLHDMDSPLTDYYIFSSHNTYLEGHQLVGNSSVNQYIEALRIGCRCVEIDCWDGPGGEPVVYHGHTFTSKIKFVDVIETLSQYAFQWTEYPLVISLEIHCSLGQQRRMAEILETILGSKIYRVPFDSRNMSCFPSPNALKGKILLKSRGRLMKVFSQFESLLTRRQDHQSNQRAYTRREFNQWRQSVMRVWNQMALNQDESILSNDIDTTNLRIMNLVDNYRNIKDRQSKSLEKLFDEDQLQIQIQGKSQTEWNIEKLLCLFGANVDFGSVVQQEDLTIWNICSLDENKLKQVSQSDGAALVDFNRSHFTRVYPSGSRVDSSNYDPIQGLVSGSQMMALNIQTHDIPMMIMQSFFLQNAGCGFVKKPEYLTSNAKKKLYPSDFLTVRRKLKITVIWGINLQYLSETLSITNPQVEVFIKGTHDDENQNQIYKFNFSLKQGDIYKFANNESIFTIRSPDNAFLIILIHDLNQKIQDQGYFSIPIQCIRQGLRIVPLLNSKLDQIKQSQLLVKTTITSYTQ